MLDPGGPNERDLPPKVWGYPLKPGDRVSIETPGAGGYGPPEERALEQRQEDERDGISRGRDDTP